MVFGENTRNKMEYVAKAREKLNETARVFGNRLCNGFGDKLVEPLSLDVQLSDEALEHSLSYYCGERSSLEDYSSEDYYEVGDSKRRDAIHFSLIALALGGLMYPFNTNELSWGSFGVSIISNIYGHLKARTYLEKARKLENNENFSAKLKQVVLNTYSKAVRESGSERKL